jgi:hypothetical protein
MTMIVLAMVLTAAPASELHFFPSGFTVKGEAVDVALPNGPWFLSTRVDLSAAHEGLVVCDAEGTAHLVVREKKTRRVTDDVLVAGLERLEHAYERTTNGWLLRKGAGWELVTSEFLLDFELEDPSIPGTQNITGTKSVVRAFKKGKFEFVSNQLPAKGTFAIKK